MNRDVYLWALVGLALIFPGGATAYDETLVTVVSRPGIKQKFLMLKPDHPSAAVILFAGGHGGLRLSSAFGKPVLQWGGNNFLVRTRKQLAEHGFIVAVMDSPSDRKKMTVAWRMSSQHAEDIRSVVQALKSVFGGPVWVVGTSMGTFSASAGAIALAGQVDGLVLTSSVTRSKKSWDIFSAYPRGIMDMQLEMIKVPVLIVAHRQDGCKLTPPGDTAGLKSALKHAPKVELLSFDGGERAKSEPCKALSAHGFYGIEAQVVSAIADFVKANNGQLPVSK